MQIIFSKVIFLSLLAGLFIASSATAQGGMRPFESGPVHEAYMESISGSINIMEAIPQNPPKPINERIPEQTDDLAIWIPGYWFWSEEQNNFIWVTGVWRRPPPGQHWISGHWTQTEEGWVYIDGFWSPASEQNLVYNSIAPPDPIPEEMGESPADDFFWLTGYWVYSEEDNDYVWIPGEWKQLDPLWIMVPAHYVWLPEGYVFVPAYWDWPVDKRGVAYHNAMMEPGSEAVSYQPTIVVEPVILLKRLVFYYPNYLHCFHHHYYYHKAIWVDYPFVPPWWGWISWWGFKPYDHWAVWWWYMNPGYPHPRWLDAHIIAQIPPPPGQLIVVAKRVRPPIIVTPNGVVPPRVMLDLVSRRERGRVVPVINQKIKIEINERLPKVEKREKADLRPSGKTSTRELVSNIKREGPKPNLKEMRDQAVRRMNKGKVKELSPQELQQFKQKNPQARIPSKPTEEQANRQKKEQTIRRIDSQDDQKQRQERAQKQQEKSQQQEQLQKQIQQQKQMQQQLQDQDTKRERQQHQQQFKEQAQPISPERQKTREMRHQMRERIREDKQELRRTKF